MFNFHHVSTVPFFSLWLCSPNPGLGRLHETLSFTSVTRSTTVGRTPWTGDQLVARPLTCTQRQKNAHTTQTLKHPCPEWDSNTRYRRPRERRQFMPQAAWLPWPAHSLSHAAYKHGDLYRLTFSDLSFVCMSHIDAIRLSYILRGVHNIKMEHKVRCFSNKESHGSLVGWCTMLQAGRSRGRFPMRSLDFSIDLILPVSLWPWSRLSLWKKRVPVIFLGVKDGRQARKPDSLTAISEPIF
jgi:hypothetical protein